MEITIGKKFKTKSEGYVYCLKQIKGSEYFLTLETVSGLVSCWCAPEQLKELFDEVEYKIEETDEEITIKILKAAGAKYVTENEVDRTKEKKQEIKKGDIGYIFTYKGKKIIIKKCDSQLNQTENCKDCVCSKEKIPLCNEFNEKIASCHFSNREDGQNVYFEEIKEVKENVKNNDKENNKLATIRTYANGLKMHFEDAEIKRVAKILLEILDAE